MAGAAAGSAQTMDMFTLGAGDVAGGYFAAASAICDVVNRSEVGQVRCSPDPTVGSVYNLDGLRRGELDFALVQSDLQAQAYKGTGRFSSLGPMTGLRSVMGLYPETMTILLGKDVVANDISDLVGLRVDLGHPSSGRRATVDRMLGALGLEEGDFSDVLELPVGIALGALCDGTLDATLLIVGHPNAGVAEAIQRCGAVVLGLNRAELAQILADGTDLSAASIPMQDYDADASAVPSFSVTATMVTRADVPAELVEAVVADTLANLEKLGRREEVLKGLTPATLRRTGLTAPLHPAAETAFDRAGAGP
jgi:TRAP transporter TAXI family solute receptor